MLEVLKDKGVLVDDGNFFARTSAPGILFAEFVDGSWVKPKDCVDPWEAEAISWEEFERRTSTRAGK